jgi:hypothetical protein
VVALSAVAGSACRRDAQMHGKSDARFADSSASSDSRVESTTRRTGCAAQAARVAAHSGWRATSGARSNDRPLRWTSHYSEKYDECYVLIERAVPVQQGSDAVVSELWDAFGAAVLAESTADRRSTVRRSVCQVNVSDEPFTSCSISRYFINEHMTH